MRLYRYLGPPEIQNALQDAHANYSTARHKVRCFEEVKAWCKAQNSTEETPTFTFVVDAARWLWIADRHSEHVACARGGLVRAAGEITLDLGAARVQDVTNQSTGYCPEPSSYPALAAALTRGGIEHPAAYTRSFDFRLCICCGLLNVVKEEDWFCVGCDSPLSEAWNCDALISQAGSNGSRAPFT